LRVKSWPPPSALGYLLGVRIALGDTRRWLGLGALTVTAAAALVASPPASGATTPLPDASWHGRPIRQMEPTRRTAVSRTTAAAAALARPGDGYGVPAGSPRVRAIQRTLLRLGYRCGPVDGMYGPLTRASVQWFQIKHGFPPTGVVDRATLRYLRSRATGSPPATTAPVAHAPPAEPAARSAATPAPGAHRRHRALLPILIAALCVIAVALLAALLLRRHLARVPRIALPLPRAAPPPPLPEPTLPLGHALTVGYAAGRDKRELDRQATAIGRACAERGWKLAGLVREGVTAEPQSGGRPGLKHAIGRLSERTPSRLVVERLDHVARSPAELATVLAWCRRNGVDLAALDVGLDTGTPEGRLAARSLLAAGETRRRR
jgi:Resolvase, N terminal domain/Putative peptidoglycan binding domain